MWNGITAALAATALGAVAAAPSAVAASAGEPRASGSAAQETATVSVLHGVPGLTADIYANDRALLSNVTPGSLSEPLKVPAGSYDIEVFKAGEGPGGTPAVGKNDVQVGAGDNATVAAHLSENGDPTLTAFVNDTSKVPAGQARLTVRHVAAAPAVDVRADGEPVVRDLSNPDEAERQVPAGSAEADAVLAGTDTAVVWPSTLPLAEGTNTIVYAWGSAPERNIKLAVQTITGLQSAPGGVPGGTGGQAAESGGGAPAWLFGLTGLAVLVTVGAGARLAVLRRRG